MGIHVCLRTCIVDVVVCLCVYGCMLVFASFFSHFLIKPTIIKFYIPNVYTYVSGIAFYKALPFCKIPNTFISSINLCIFHTMSCFLNCTCQFVCYAFLYIYIVLLFYESVE